MPTDTAPPRAPTTPAPPPDLKPALTPQALLLANRRGIIAMSLAMASFVLNDALVKRVSESLPGAQLIFLRGVCAVLVLLVTARVMGALGPRLSPPGGWRQLLVRPVLARSALDASASMVYLTALFQIPLAIATAINMSAPLLIALYAMLFMGEQVTRARWLAIVAGFGGVLLIVQPAGSAFNAWSLLALGGTLLHTARDLATRHIPGHIPTILVALAGCTAIALLSAVVSVFQGWRPVSAASMGLLALASVFLSAAYVLLTVAMRAGEVSVVSPFRYSGLLFAIVLGWLMWRDMPNLPAWAGIALLVGAGLFMLHHEKRRTEAAS